MSNPKLPNVRKWYGERVAAEVKRRNRPVPQMRRHTYGRAFVAFKVKGVRRFFYLGPWDSEQARARYAAFVQKWPAQLDESAPAGKWSKVRLITFRGRTMSLARWAHECGLKPTTVRHRLDVRKWTVERALTTPKIPPAPPPRRAA